MQAALARADQVARNVQSPKKHLSDTTPPRKIANQPKLNSADLLVDESKKLEITKAANKMLFQVEYENMEP